jgi:uncharacterized NAD(P)/FAD-binding protein YdhS
MAPPTMRNLTRIYEVAVIGSGASGSLVAAQFRRVAHPTARLAFIEAGARAARGLAYGTPYGAHLLNVPAGRLSGLVADPDHFVRWLKARLPQAHAGTFAPRSLYGTYLTELLDEKRPNYPELMHVNGTAVGLTQSGGRWVAHLHDGRTLTARAIVLALGSLPPADPLGLADKAPAEYLRDPWTPGAALGLSPGAQVLLIGTGHTMVDVALALHDSGHRGPVHAISPHGRLPEAHTAFTPRPLTGLPSGLDSPAQTLHWLRGELRAAGRSEHDWRAVIDSLRPHTPAIWQQWSAAARASFVRHAKRLWNLHRHRLAPEVAARIEALRSSGELTILRGRALGIRDTGDGLEVSWRPAGVTKARGLRVARVINCTDPASDFRRVDLPLVVEMRRAGWLVPDRLGLGIETAPDGQLIGADGEPVAGLYTLGPLRRPQLWESTTIPEIRAQAADLAGLLAQYAGGVEGTIRSTPIAPVARTVGIEGDLRGG